MNVIILYELLLKLWPRMFTKITRLNAQIHSGKLIFILDQLSTVKSENNKQ